MSKYSVKELWDETYGKTERVRDYAGRLMLKSARCWPMSTGGGGRPWPLQTGATPHDFQHGSQWAGTLSPHRQALTRCVHGYTELPGPQEQQSQREDHPETLRLPCAELAVKVTVIRTPTTHWTHEQPGPGLGSGWEERGKHLSSNTCNASKWILPCKW